MNSKKKAKAGSAPSHFGKKLHFGKKKNKATPGKMALIGAGVAAVATSVYLIATKGSRAAARSTQKNAEQAKPAASAQSADATTNKPAKSAASPSPAANAAPAATADQAAPAAGAAANVDVALNNEVASYTEHNPNNAGDFTDDGATGNAD